jgi:hypothetical protein
MDDEYQNLIKLVEDKSDELHRACYASNNTYAYYSDIGNEKNKKSDGKLYNFVPTYDKWCLYCYNKNAKSRCLGCKTVYFCNRDCQKAAWKIHKNHCGRNQFIVCATCGVPDTDTTFTEMTEKFIMQPMLVKTSFLNFKCDKCPVSWCSQECKDKIYSQHKDIDCNNFSKLFS